MLNCIRRISWRFLQKLGKFCNLLIVFAMLFSITGIALAVVETSTPTFLSPTVNYLVPGAVLIQLVLFGAWIGSSRTQLKHLTLAMESSGDKHDSVVIGVNGIGTSVSKMEITVEDHGRRIIKLEDTQKDCNFYNRSPNEFMKVK